MASMKIVRPCEKCGEDTEHWDNRLSKKNPKAPDYKCITCGNAIWSPKPKKQFPPSVPQSSTSVPKNGTDAKKEMLLSYAKDIVVAEISKGEVKEPFKRVADGFKVLFMAYTYPFGQPTKKIAEVDLDEPPVDPDEQF